MKPIIFCDFDGTITDEDTTDAILDAFADPLWRDVEERWVAGQIGSRECLREQMTLVRASEEDLGKLVDGIPLVAHFVDFASECIDRGFPFHVISDGFDWVIHRTLERPEFNGVSRNLKIAASSLQVQERFMITTFPHSSVRCTHGCATCKPSLMVCEAKDCSPVIFIGDGNSDRHAVSCADLVFARRGKSLMKYCSEKNIPYIPFEDFNDVRRELNPALAHLAARLPVAKKPLILSYETES